MKEATKKIIADIPKRWTPAKTLEEAKERASAQVKKFNSSSADLNAIWNLFKATPEIFLFDEYVERIRRQYKSSHTYIYNNANTQLDNLEFTLERIQGVARKFYTSFLQQETSTTNSVNKHKEGEESMKEPKKILTSSIKKSLVGDKTDIREFIRGCDETRAQIVLAYLQQRGITTLGDFLDLLNDKNKSNAFTMYISKHNLQDVNTILRNNIVEWATSDDKTATFAQDAPVETAEQKIEVSDKDFFEYLKTLPAAHFVKGSKEMEKISERYRVYLDNQTKSFVDDGFSEEDLKEVIEGENAKYQPIVDAKREQYERELKRDAVAAYTRKLIDESVKYHHDPRMFDHQPKHEGHKHFPDNGREL